MKCIARALSVAVLSLPLASALVHGAAEYACSKRTPSAATSSLTSRALARSITDDAGTVVPSVNTWAWPSFTIDTASV